MRHRAGDREGGEALAYQAAHHGDTDALNRLASGFHELGGPRLDHSWEKYS
ncbi:hypothetical protein [Streptomyces europaeiscabiei]|uniref:hypothetical protein n=1 Tax=Streptomyces europaeiscabiei TaxID=146819 RepID=UPI00131E6635|nr:hypothetical protein [Streptomyces europaeiscabiei]